ncbi:MAG: hypothetical protein MUE67_08905 [Anaerolineales bacterium]|nr:hypothetical protein [Anaerolineales bacterium]
MPDFQTRLAARLLTWSAGSILSGLLLALSRRPLWRGLGHQFAGWGLIDGLIGWFGLRSARQSLPVAANRAEEQAGLERRALTLERVLVVNTALDLFYLAGGVNLLRRRGRQDPYWRGAGLGILAQAAFLFGFDLYHWQVIKTARQAGRAKDVYL